MSPTPPPLKSRRRRRWPRVIGAAIGAIFFALAILPLPVSSNPLATRATWVLLANEGSSAKFDSAADLLKIEVTRLKAKKPYEVRLERIVAARKGEGWRVRFQVRTSGERNLICRLIQGAAPWGLLAPEKSFAASPTWSRHEIYFIANADEPDARIQFLAGDSVGSVELQGVSLDPVQSSDSTH